MHSEINILELATVDSTNSYAKSNFDELPDGTLVVAEEQTAGRGRLGRTWISPAGRNIYASLVMKKISNPFYATIVASLSVLDVLEDAAPRMDFFIKWPNDVYTVDRKIAGILCECTAGADGAVNGVIAGIGININLEKEEIDAIDQPAASLKYLTGCDYNVKKIVGELAESLKRYYIIYSASPEALFSEWKHRNLVIGRKIELIDAGGTVKRVFVRDIAESGELVAESDGKVFLFHCGDVRILRDSFSRI